MSYQAESQSTINEVLLLIAVRHSEESLGVVD